MAFRATNRAEVVIVLIFQTDIIPPAGMDFSPLWHSEGCNPPPPQKKKVSTKGISNSKIFSFRFQLEKPKTPGFLGHWNWWTKSTGYWLAGYSSSTSFWLKMRSFNIRENPYIVWTIFTNDSLSTMKTPKQQLFVLLSQWKVSNCSLFRPK